MGDLYLIIHTQEGYMGGIPLYMHPGRLYGRYTLYIHHPEVYLVGRYPPCLSCLFSRFTVGQ